MAVESRRGRFKFQVATSQPIDTQEANGLAPSKQRELPQSPSSLPRESAISRNETLQSREGPFSKQISRVQSENGINNEPTAEKIHGTKIGRFEVSSGKASTSETTYSPHSTHIGQSPGISPSSSISRGQGLKIESSSLYFHIQTLLKQNEAQHTILSELMGLNESEPIINFKAQQQKNMQKLLQINGNSGEGKFMTNEVTASLVSINLTIPKSLKIFDLINKDLDSFSKGALDRQIQSIIQENEELRKENEALKVKIEQLKKSSTVNITGGNTPMLSPNNLTTPATTSTATETALITITPSSSSNTNASH
ncbi:hypothetical protein G9A89_007067 [Geosiphon pyriformis]|nr:hypothetical protein G9A89_007067 [Geosiphon pyriformis]